MKKNLKTIALALIACLLIGVICTGCENKDKEAEVSAETEAEDETKETSKTSSKKSSDKNAEDDEDNTKSSAKKSDKTTDGTEVASADTDKTKTTSDTSKKNSSSSTSSSKSTSSTSSASSSGTNSSSSTSSGHVHSWTPLYLTKVINEGEEVWVESSEPYEYQEWVVDQAAYKELDYIEEQYSADGYLLEIPHYITHEEVGHYETRTAYKDTSHYETVGFEYGEQLDCYTCSCGAIKCLDGTIIEP